MLLVDKYVRYGPLASLLLQVVLNGRSVIQGVDFHYIGGYARKLLFEQGLCSTTVRAATLGEDYNGGAFYR